MTTVVTFDEDLHWEPVVELWAAVFGYETAHNAPDVVLKQKQAVDDGLFFVALAPGNQEHVIGTVMAGYDGHRGWLYAVAVHPSWQGRGIGTMLVRHAEAALIARGCLKINLQIMDGNEGVRHFYESVGYEVEPRISMGKRLLEGESGES